MAPGGQVPPCSKRRRIDSQSEMADNSLAEVGWGDGRKTEREKDQGGV